MEPKKPIMNPEVLDLSLFAKAPLMGDSFETFAGYFILEAVGRLDRNDAIGQVFGSRDKIVKAEVCLTFNGAQVPFVEVLRRFHAQWDSIVQAEAHRLLDEKFSDRTSDIFSLLDDIKDKMMKSVGASEGEANNDT